MDVHSKLRGEPGCLALPVAYQRHRTDQEAGGVVLLVREERKQLHRLAEAHVVGENTT
jgi:hypothetical protein